MPDIMIQDVILDVILNQLMANEVANTLSMRAFFNIFQSWVSHIQITCKEALPFYMPKMIIQDAVLFGILNNHFRHARRQSFFVSNLYLWYETLNYPRKTPALIRNLWLRLPFYHSSILFFYQMKLRHSFWIIHYDRLTADTSDHNVTKATLILSKRSISLPVNWPTLITCFKWI